MQSARELLVLALATLSGCASNHAALNPAGPRAQAIAHLLMIFCTVSTAVYLTVIGFLLWSLFRRRASADDAHALARQERRSRRVIGSAVGLTVVTLLTLATADFAVQRSLQAHPADALRIVLTGHQYWWEVEYDDPDPSRRLHTANEVHIPVHRAVEFVLTSSDVIHSFWLPSLMGKKDLIPGYTNTEVVIADHPGVFTGQCAEFCGLQHAQMRLALTAEAPAAYERWRQQQLAEAAAPTDDRARRGQQVFMNSTCILCHAIQGTSAGATVGPDLTHLASRQMIGAGAMPNTPANLASWILNPHTFKPGVTMPATALSGDELSALTAYLGGLR